MPQLQQFKCRKVVRAAKIVDHLRLFPEGPEAESTVRLDFETPYGKESVEVSSAWCEKHHPQDGGYYVVYDDGYASYSPAEAFEAGYMPIPNCWLFTRPREFNEHIQVRETVEDQYAYHTWDADQKAVSDYVRTLLMDAAEAIMRFVPPGADRSVALRKLREVRMDANSAITHYGRY